MSSSWEESFVDEVQRRPVQVVLGVQPIRQVTHERDVQAERSGSLEVGESFHVNAGSGIVGRASPCDHRCPNAEAKPPRRGLRHEIRHQCGRPMPRERALRL